MVIFVVGDEVLETAFFHLFFTRKQRRQFIFVLFRLTLLVICIEAFVAIAVVRVVRTAQCKYSQLNMNQRKVKTQRILSFGDKVALRSSYPKSWPGTSLNLRVFIKRDIRTLLSNSANVCPIQCRGPKENGR